MSWIELAGGGSENLSSPGFPGARETNKELKAIFVVSIGRLLIAPVRNSRRGPIWALFNGARKVDIFCQ